MADENRVPGLPPDQVETQSETPGTEAELDALRRTARVEADEALRQKEAAQAAAADIARERDLAAAEANRLAAERDQAAAVAAVQNQVASQNAFGFWLIIGVVVAALVVAILFAATRRPWEGPEQQLNRISLPPPAATGTATSAPASSPSLPAAAPSVPQTVPSPPLATPTNPTTVVPEPAPAPAPSSTQAEPPPIPMDTPPAGSDSGPSGTTTP